MKNRKNTLKWSLAFLLLAIGLQTLQSQPWEVLRVRGEIWVANKMVQMGAQIDSASTIRFSKNTDIMAVRPVTKPEIFKLVQPKNFTYSLDSAIACVQENCPPVWRDPLFISQAANLTITINAQGDTIYSNTSTLDTMWLSLDEYWKNIKGPSPPLPQPGIRYKVISAVGHKALDVAGYNPNNEAVIQIWDVHGGPNQRWTLHPLDKGYFVIQSDLGRVIDIQWGISKPQTPVHMWDRHNGAAQQWKLIPAGDGWYYIQSIGGLYLDVRLAQNANGVRVWIYPFNGSIAQKWKFVE